VKISINEGVFVNSFVFQIRFKLRKSQNFSEMSTSITEKSLVPVGSEELISIENYCDDETAETLMERIAGLKEMFSDEFGGLGKVSLFIIWKSLQCFLVYLHNFGYSRGPCHL